MSTSEPLECLDDPDFCKGQVQYHSVDPGRATAVPRCEFHWGERLDRANDPNSMEMYANSDVAPSWFGPTSWGGVNEDGERWSEDDY